MLSPEDIQNKEFKKSAIGGYQASEVNEFLDEVLESYQQMIKENCELRDKMNMLNENIQYYRTMEGTIQNALVLAEKTAQDTKALAYKKADQVKKEAEHKADVLDEHAKQEVYNISHKTEELKKQFLAFKVQVKQICQGQLELIEQQNITMFDEEYEPTPMRFDEVESVEDTLETTDDTWEEVEDDTFYTKEFTVLGEAQ